MNEILNFIQSNMPLIILGTVSFFLIRSGLIGKIGEMIGEAFGSFGSSLSLMIALIIVVFGVIVLFRPQFFSFVWGPGPLGPNRQVNQAEANLTTHILDPTNDPSLWSNAVAREAAAATEAKYKAETVKHLTSATATQAEQACYLPKGHPDRDWWDVAGIDPCEESLPAGLKASSRAVARSVDLATTEKTLSQPFGTAPTGTDPWIRSLYQLPKGIVLAAALLLIIPIVGLAFRMVLRAVRS